jgi:Spy/CpxP family protein refolding chaperone
MSTRLQLNDDQKTKVQQIFGDTRQQLQSLRKESEPRVSEIRQQTDQKLQQVLTPAQWSQFQQLRNEMRARRGPQNRDR